MQRQSLAAALVVAVATSCGGALDRAPAAPAAAPEPDAPVPTTPEARADEDAAVRVSWARSLEGTSYGAAWGTALGPDGSIVMAGAFEGSLDLDPGPGSRARLSAGDLDVFIVALDASGDLRWGQTLGGIGEDSAREAAMRPDGSVAVAGCFEGAVDFDPGPGTDVRTSNGESDAFVTVLDADGALVWARTFGGGGIECALRVEAGSDGSVILAGGFDGTTDLDPGAALDAHATAGQFDAFIVALGPTGDLRWSRAFGGPGDDIVAALAVGPGGELGVAGYFEDVVDLDAGPGSSQVTAAGFSDAFVARFEADGRLAWARSFGGPDTDKAIALTIGPGETFTVSGSFEATADLDPGPGQRLFVSKGASDAFVVQLDPTGATRWIQTFGAETADDGVGVAALADGTVLAAVQGRPFLARLGADALPSWTWSPQRSESPCEAWSLEAGPDGMVAVVGVFRDAIDFDPGPGSDVHRPTNETDPTPFVLRLLVAPAAP